MPTPTRHTLHLTVAFLIALAGSTNQIHAAQPPAPQVPPPSTPAAPAPAPAKPTESAKPEGTPAAPAALPATASSAAPSTQAAPVPVRLAVCDVYKCADKLASTERYTKQLKDKAEDLSKKAEALRAEVTRMTDEMNLVPKEQQKGEEWDKRVAAYRAKRTENEQTYQALKADYSDFVTAKNLEMYKEVVAAVDAIATKRGYTWVLNSRTLDDGEKPNSPETFIRGLLARPVIKAPPADDLTLDVMKDLHLD